MKKVRHPFLQWLDRVMKHTTQEKRSSPGEEPKIHDVSAPQSTPYDSGTVAKALGAGRVSKKQ